jgi:hypothetical protein
MLQNIQTQYPLIIINSIATKTLDISFYSLPVFAANGHSKLAEATQINPVENIEFSC